MLKMRVIRKGVAQVAGGTGFGAVGRGRTEVVDVADDGEGRGELFGEVIVMQNGKLGRLAGSGVMVVVCSSRAWLEDAAERTGELAGL